MALHAIDDIDNVNDAAGFELVWKSDAVILLDMLGGNRRAQRARMDQQWPAMIRARQGRFLTLLYRFTTG